MGPPGETVRHCSARRLQKMLWKVGLILWLRLLGSFYIFVMVTSPAWLP
jgi:hypothetical protein